MWHPKNEFSPSKKTAITAIKNMPGTLHAKICLIPDTEDQCVVENYRPILLLPVADMVVECIAAANIVNHVEKHSILLQKQHRFCKGHSVLTELTEIRHDFSLGVSDRVRTNSLFLDFWHAFDKVVHKKLVQKLQHILHVNAGI